MTRALRVLIVDDEPPARSRLRRMLETDPGIEVVDEAANGMEAVSKAQASSPDLVMLDIRMPGMDGLETAHHLGQLMPAPAVIFTTAYDRHALEAFELRALDYLLKPIRADRLRASLDRLRDAGSNALEGEDVAEKAAPRAYLSARVGGGLRLIPVKEVRFLRADRKYVEAITAQGVTVLDESLSALEAEFGEAFIRIHRSTLVNVSYVTALTRSSGAGYRVELADIDETLDVSRRMVAAVRARLRIR